jgi:hypothetical protein
VHEGGRSDPGFAFDTTVERRRQGTSSARSVASNTAQRVNGRCSGWGVACANSMQRRASSALSSARSWQRNRGVKMFSRTWPTWFST